MNNKILKIFTKILKNNIYTVGDLIYDSTRSQPYRVNKQSIFKCVLWEYNDESKPEKFNDYHFDVLVRNPGKFSEFYFVKTFQIKDIQYFINKYKNE